MSTKKHSSRGGVKRSRRHNTSGWRHWLRRVLRSPRELSRRWRSMAAAGFNEMETDVDDDYGEIETRWGILVKTVYELQSKTTYINAYFEIFGFFNKFI